MPIEVGLLSTQQDSFKHHEELSKLLNETDVFYVPLRNELLETNVNINPDRCDLPKRFDEDVSNRHLIVTFREIGYSLFLDSVQSLSDETDRSKVRVSGKMIVDGICIQFFGCFDCSQTQQINGVGRIELDENYYRELSLTNISEDRNVKNEQQSDVQPLIISKAGKLKQSAVSASTSSKRVTRLKPPNENILTKHQTSPPLVLNETAPSYSLRSHQHSPSHMPYTLLSPRITNNAAKQHQNVSPVQSATSETLSPTIPPTFTEYSLINSSNPPLIDTTSHSSRFPPSTSTPIQIPAAPTPGLSTASFQQLANLFPMAQSQSLPAYFFPSGNIAYLTTPSSGGNPSLIPFDFSSLVGNTSMVLITNHGQHSSQPVQILTPIDYRSLQFTPYISNGFSMPVPPSSRTCNILPPSPSPIDPKGSLQTKRHDNDDDNAPIAPIESNKQSEEQLPFKKRRYTGQLSPMAIVHDDDDDEEGSDESARK